MAISAFGVEDSRLDLVYKADNSNQRSAGRTLTTQLFPGYHGAIAGRKGKKVRATANEAGAGYLGSAGGGVLGTRLGALAGGRGSVVGGLGGALLGTVGGVHAGMRRNQRRGYYKPVDND